MYLDEKEFLELRVNRVREAASLFDALEDMGHAPRWRGRSGQMKCVFASENHEKADNNPSARYYPTGERDEYETYYCWVCTPRPLDIIHFQMRKRSGNFYDALRYLEHQYGVKYEDVQVSKGVEQDLRDLDQKARAIDVGPVFEYCEKFLRDGRSALSMPRFVALCLALDRIYYTHNEDKISATVTRLEKWKAAAVRVSTPRSEDADQDLSKG